MPYFGSIEMEVVLTPEHLVAVFYIKLHKVFETVSDTH
jgi:hypothetical protein